MNIENAINHGTKILKKNSIKSAKSDSEILMSKVVGKEKEFILLNQNNYHEKDIFFSFMFK